MANRWSMLREIVFHHSTRGIKHVVKTNISMVRNEVILLFDCCDMRKFYTMLYALHPYSQFLLEYRDNHIRKFSMDSVVVACPTIERLILKWMIKTSRIESYRTNDIRFIWNILNIKFSTLGADCKLTAAWGRISWFSVKAYFMFKDSFWCDNRCNELRI